MSRSCQSGMPFGDRGHVAADDPGQPGDPLGHDRVLLVRHRAGALLPGPERLGQLPDLGALPVPHLQPDRLAHRHQDGQRRHPLGDAVPQHDLGRHVGRPQPQRRRHRRLQRRVHRRVRPHRAADLRHGDRRPGPAAAGPGTAPPRTRGRPAGARARPARRGSRAYARPAACPGAPGRAPAAPRPGRRPWSAARRWPPPAAAPAPCPAGRTTSVRSGRTRRPPAGWCCRPTRTGRRSRRAG